MPLLSLNINWNNSVIFHPILTFFYYLKLLDFLVMILLFGPIFAPRPQIGKIARMQHGPKTTLQKSGFPSSSASKEGAGVAAETS